MTGLRRVLAAVDFSESARSAFDHALALSRQHGAELFVVHAITTEWPHKWHARERRSLIRSLRGAAHESGVRFKISLESGDPAGVIVRHASDRRADVIVLGASERSGFDRFRFGSVVETVAVKAMQSVLVIPATENAGDALRPFKSIVVAVDLSEGSAAAVAKARSMAGENTRITVVHVVPGVPLAGASRYMYRVRDLDFQRQMARDAWRRVSEIVPANAVSPRVHARVAMGDPVSEISRVAHEADADLILVGVRPRGVIARLLFGSTAARVIHTARVPVLTMPQPSDRVTVRSGDEEDFAVAA